MNTDESKALFREADELYRANEYEKALKILEKLNTTFPNTRQIMFPMARCMVKLHYLQDAAALCDEIYEKFGFEKAKKLRARISQITPSSLNFDALDLDFDALLHQNEDSDSDF